MYSKFIKRVGAKSNKPAFTLIELLVVIAIIGLLTTIAVISLNNARAKARDAKRVADVKQTQTALELFFNDKGRYPTTGEFTLGSLFSTSTNGTTTYMAILPTAANPPDGSCTANQNTFAYTGSSNGSSYTISYCIGGVVGSLTTGPHCATPAGIADGTTCAGGGSACPSSVSYGGESYPTIQIGSQCWLAKNLNIGTYIGSGSSADGFDGIPGNADDCTDVSGQGWGLWSCQGYSGIQKYCYSDSIPGGDLATCTTDGGLYEWAETMGLPYYCNYTTYTCNGTTCVSTEYSPACDYPDPAATKRQGICPTGWHIPSFIELQTLAQNSDPGCDLAGGTCSTAGGKLKASSTSTPIAWDGTNDYSFSAIPAGYRTPYGSFHFRGDYAYLWSSLPYAGYPSVAWYGALYSAVSFFSGGYGYRAGGFSVRCLQD